MKLSVSVIIVLILFSSNLLANENEEVWTPIAGQHYQSIASKLSYQTGIQFYFWPGSASCYQLESALQDWQLLHPDIKIERIPLIKRPQWRLLAKAWLVALAMDSEDNHQGISFLNALYQAIHMKLMPINTPAELEQFIISLDISPQDFMTRFNSPAINLQLKIFQQQASLLPITGVPTLIINNQWLSDASMATTAAQFIAILDHVITP